MKTVFKSSSRHSAHVEAFVTDSDDFVEVQIPFNYSLMTIEETVDLIDLLVEALQTIAKTKKY